MPHYNNTRTAPDPTSVDEVISRIGAGMRATVEQSMYLDDPVSYLDLFPFKPWAKEKEMFKELFTGEKKILLVRSCNNVGKTHTAAQAIIAWLDIYRYDAKVISTAKNFDAVRFMLWTRVRSMYKHVAHRFNNAPMNQTDFMPDPDPIDGHPEWIAVGYNPKIEGTEATAFQGHHAKHILFVVDEAITTPAAIWKAIEGSLLSDGAKVLAIYNPTTTEGSEVYHMEKDKRGKLITISCWDLFNSPEYQEDPSHYSMLVTEQGARELIETYGRDHPIVKARLDGEWVDNSEDMAVKGSDLERSGAQHFRWNKEQPHEGVLTKLLFGWDVAGEGSDDNALYLYEQWDLDDKEWKDGHDGKRKRVLVGKNIRLWHGGNHADSLSYVYEFILQEILRVNKMNSEYVGKNKQLWSEGANVQCTLSVDSIGEGSHVPSMIRKWDTEGNIGTIAFKAGEKAKKITEHKEIEILNKISEAWYRMGLITAGRISGWPEIWMKGDKNLFSELRSRKRYFGMKNKEPLVYYVEPKSEWRERNRGNSPDTADAALMALYGYFHGATGRVRMMTM